MATTVISNAEKQKLTTRDMYKKLEEKEFSPDKKIRFIGLLEKDI
jgi:hypothetical protein